MHENTRRPSGRTPAVVSAKPMGASDRCPMNAASPVGIAFAFRFGAVPRSTVVPSRGGILECKSREDAARLIVRMRVRVQNEVAALREAHELGLALEMSIAAAGVEIAVQDLVACVHDFLRCESALGSLVRAALYECDALHEIIMALFSMCVGVGRPGCGARGDSVSSVAELYPWLRECLEYHARRVDCLLSL